MLLAGGLVLAGCGEPPTPPTPTDPCEVFEVAARREACRYHMKWFANPQGIMKNRFLGTRTWQNPLDVWITQEILFEVKPDIVVEAGTYRGGSASLWAILLENINPDGEVITIDIEDKRSERSKNLRVVKERVTFLHGSSTAPEIVEEVRRRIEGKRALFILDSLHTREHVLAELRAYGDMVAVGSYIIVQDTIGTGAIYAIRDYLKENDAFVRDASRERLMISNNVEGFLKRVR